MLDAVLGIPDHIRDALWRFDSAQLKSRPSAGLAVCGMGGSAIGAELACGLVGERLTGPLFVNRSYQLPQWIDSDWTVLASSYSGDTEETLAAYTAAGEAGTRRWAAGVGGKLGERAREDGVPMVGLPGFFQPRATVAYMTTIAVCAAHMAGVAPDLRRELEQAADFLERCRDELRQQASAVAEQIGELPVVVHGADLTLPVARRWANQFNENAKQHAFSAEIPEANHNMMEAWDLGRGDFGAVFLTATGQSDRERRRMELTAATVERAGRPVISVESRGETRSERVFWTVMLGDLVSLEVAELRGVDPLPVAVIEDFKRRLKGS